MAQEMQRINGIQLELQILQLVAQIQRTFHHQYLRLPVHIIIW